MAQKLQNYFKLSPFFTDSETISDLAWERLQEKIDNLPPALINLLMDNKTSQFVESLSQKYIQLSPQGSDMARLIRDVIVGDIFIGDMPKEISNRLGIDQTIAREIANLIVSQLFTPVIEDIKKAQNERYPGRMPSQQTTNNKQQTTPLATPQVKPAETQKYPGQDLPESGGNIIDLRQQH